MANGMSPESEAFAGLYAGLSELELLKLARAYETLTEPAQSARQA